MLPPYKLKSLLLILAFLVISPAICQNNEPIIKKRSYSQDSISKYEEECLKEIIEYELNFTFSYGGESKCGLFPPKFYVYRKHYFDKISPFYGLGLGVHTALVAVYGSASAIVGIEKGNFDLEALISHFRTKKIKVDKDLAHGPYSQNLFGIKVGYRIGNVKIKLGRSFILQETLPKGDDGIPLLDLGKVNNALWGVDLQIILN